MSESTNNSEASEIDKQLTELLEDMIANGQNSDLSTYIGRIKALFQEDGVVDLATRKERFKEQCRVELLKEDRSNAKMLGDFFLYWSEHSTPVRVNTKMRWEKQPTFSLPLRYAKWEKQAVKFSIVNQLKKK